MTRNGKKTEITKRRKQYESAMASARMEGFEFTKEELAIFGKIIQGEITEDEFIAKYKDDLANLKKTKPELFVNKVNVTGQDAAFVEEKD